MLRSSTRQEIVDIVEGSFFGAENYQVDFGASSSGNLVRVRFLPDTRFQFVAGHVSEDIFRVSEAPGEQFITLESVNVRGFEQLMLRLRRWLDRVRQETIASNPLSREILELRKELDARLSELGEAATTYFTKEEAGGLQDRLSIFEARLRDLASENEELRGAVEDLTKAVSDLSEVVQTINRGTWLRMAGGRLLSGLKNLAKNKEAREFALEAAKKFLLEGPK